MKERQRWRANEDSLLRAYVKQNGRREWNLVSLRMNTLLNRDAKSCSERWKTYLKPGVKKGSLAEEEKHLVIRLQSKHGSKCKKVAAELPGRPAERLGEWWEGFKEKQVRELKENRKAFDPIGEGRYDRILETFAEELVRVQSSPSFLMASSNGGLLHTDPSAPAPTLLPSWLSSSSGTSAIRPPSPSVTLSLSSSTIAPSSAQIPWLQPERGPENGPIVLGNLSPHISCGESPLMTELVDCCRELEEGHRAWASHKKEAAWRLRRIELQLESEKSSRKREKMDEIEARLKTLREEQKTALERIESEYKEQLAALKRDAEAKEQKLAEQWAAKHSRLSKFLEHMGCRSRVVDSTGR